MRRGYIVAIAVGVLLFLAISGLLARAFSANSAEQDAITSLVTAEARGDVNGVLDDIVGCRTTATCRQRAASNAARLERPGAVSIAQLTPSTASRWPARRGRPGGLDRRRVEANHAVRPRSPDWERAERLRVELLATTPRLKTVATVHVTSNAG